MIVNPPSEPGAVQLTVAWPTPATAVTFVGASGTLPSVIALDAVDAEPVPVELVAVTVKVYDLITLVRDNRETHRNVFEEALVGFRLAANRALNDRIDEISSKRVVNLVFTLPIPEDNTDDYNRVLTMLEMTLAADQ